MRDSEKRGFQSPDLTVSSEEDLGEGMPTLGMLGLVLELEDD